MVACMAVMARETWTDERLDDLTKRVDKGFDATRVEIRDLRAHTDKGFVEVKQEVCELRAETKEEFRELRTEMNTRFNGIDSRFDANQRTMVLGFASIVASILATQL